MVDRRLVTDIRLALLIALPSALPAAPMPWGTDEDPGKTSLNVDAAQPDMTVAELNAAAQGRS